MNRWAAFAPLIALGVLVIVSAGLLLRGGQQENFTAGEMGRQAPAYQLAALTEGAPPVASQSRAGRAYVVNLFASWCTPCRAEHPLLMQLEERGVEIVGVAYKDEREDAQRFITTLGNPYAEIGMDPNGRLGLELGVIGMPETFVIGPDGEIRAVHRGPLTERDVREIVEPALR